MSQTKGIVDTTTNDFSLHANIRLDHRMFGYEKPDTSSRKMICFSIFTSDIEGNPHGCLLGAYYETSGLKDGNKILYNKRVGKYSEMKFIDTESKVTLFYFKTRDLKFE